MDKSDVNKNNKLYQWKVTLSAEIDSDFLKILKCIRRDKNTVNKFNSF